MDKILVVRPWVGNNLNQEMDCALQKQKNNQLTRKKFLLLLEYN